MIKQQASQYDAITIWSWRLNIVCIVVALRALLHNNKQDRTVADQIFHSMRMREYTLKFSIKNICLQEINNAFRNPNPKLKLKKGLRLAFALCQQPA